MMVVYILRTQKPNERKKKQKKKESTAGKTTTTETPYIHTQKKKTSFLSYFLALCKCSPLIYLLINIYWYIYFFFVAIVIIFCCNVI